MCCFVASSYLCFFWSFLVHDDEHCNFLQLTSHTCNCCMQLNSGDELATVMKGLYCEVNYALETTARQRLDDSFSNKQSML